MTEDAPSLYPEPQEVAPPPGRGLHGYYHRGDNGWVVVAATTPSNRADYEYKGFTFMQQYGQFKNGTNEARARRLEKDDRGNAWNPAVEPWRLIFQRDGAKEFPLEQIIAYRWHIRPPYREVSFPQLEGIDIKSYACPECKKGLFASTNPSEATEQLRTHLTSEINNRHKYTPTDLRELGKELDIDFDSARVGRVRSVTVEEPEAELEAQPAPELTLAEPIEDDSDVDPATADGPPKCEFCDYSPDGVKSTWPQAVNMHTKMHCRSNPNSNWSKKQEPVLA